MARKRYTQNAWRIMNVANPLDSAAVNAEAERHIAFLRDTYKKVVRFNGEVVVRDGTCWGKFLVVQPQ